MFDKFSEEAIKVIMFAREEAKVLKHSNVGSEHLLLGLIAVGKPAVSFSSLCWFSLDLPKIRAQVEKFGRNGDRPSPDDLPFSVDAKQALQAAYELARNRFPVKINSGDILLGLLEKEQSYVVSLLKELGVDRQELRMTVVYKGMPTGPIVGDGSVMSDDEARELLKDCSRVIDFASNEALALGHNSVGTEMILLGLSGAGGSVAKVLGDFGATPDTVRVAINDVIGKMPKLTMLGGAPVVLPFSPRAKQLFNNALQEAFSLGHDSLCPRHLLLGMLYERDSAVFQVLKRLKIDFEELRKVGLALFNDGR